MKAVTIIACADDFLAERELARLRAPLEKKGWAVEEIAAADPQAVQNALETRSLLDAGRLVVVRDAEAMKAAAVTGVAGWAASGPEGVRLVLVASRAAGLAKALGEHADVVQVKAPPPWETPGWVVQWFRRLGRRITPEAAAALVETVGTDLRELASAAEQLTVAHEGPIDAAAVHRQFRGLDSQVWTFVDATLERDPAAALRHLHALLAKGENPIGILSALARQMRTLAVARGAGRTPAAAIARELGVKEGAVKRALRQARRFSDADVRGAFRALAEADVALKGGERGEQEPPEMVLELLVAEICGARVRA